MRLTPANFCEASAFLSAGAGGVTAIAWLYLFIADQDMDIPMAGMAGMSDMAMPFAAPWVFAMWWVMMLGIMLPSAAPMILTYATLQRRKRERDESYVPTTMFVAGSCSFGVCSAWQPRRRSGCCSRAPCCPLCSRWPVRCGAACCSSWPVSTS